MQQHPMTIKGMKKIQEELEKLVKVDREEIKKAIQEARELGDLKENAEYHSAKERQSLNEGRIAQLQGVVANAKVIDTSSIMNDKIVFGATINLLDVNTEKRVVYQIVGKEESDVSRGLISYISPLGKALIGKKVGDVVNIKVPRGEMEYEVVSFEYK